MKKKKLIIFIFLIALVIILNRTFNFFSYLSLDEAGLQRLKNLAVENYMLAALLYLVFSIIGYSLLALPGITFAIAAGIIFNPLLGTVLCLISATVAACISFIVGRFFLKDSIKPAIMKNKYLKKWIFDGDKKNYVFVLMLTRLVPVFPYNLQNFAYGVSDIPFTEYMVFSFIFMIPGTALYIFGTAGVVDSSNRLLFIAVSAVLAVFVFVITALLKRKYVQSTEACDPPKKNNPCVSCKVCTANCEFLKKYKLDFNDTAKLQELAYHCFLCGKCTEVCPHNVDGRKFMLNLRQHNVKKSGDKVNGYFFLQKEKSNYIFKNYRNGKTKSVLFPGCNYPSMYPKTLELLVKIFEQKNIGVAFDCCGKPIAELGLVKDEQAIYERLNTQFEKCGIEEIITLCPNCYYHLHGKLKVKITTVYEKLLQLGLGHKLQQAKINIFLPCPDRKNKLWLEKMKPYLPDTINFIEQVQCCGLGGCAIVKEPEIAKNFSHQVQTELQKNNSTELFVYCATCAGNFKRNGIDNVRHLLNEILDSTESPNVNHSFVNRAKSKFMVRRK